MVTEKNRLVTTFFCKIVISFSKWPKKAERPANTRFAGPSGNYHKIEYAA